VTHEIVAVRHGIVRPHASELASDAVHRFEQLALERPFGVMVNLRETRERYELLEQLRAAGASIIPGHDPLVSSRHPDLGGDAAGLAFQIA